MDKYLLFLDQPFGPESLWHVPVAAEASFVPVTWLLSAIAQIVPMSVVQWVFVGGIMALGIASGICLMQRISIRLGAIPWLAWWVGMALWMLSPWAYARAALGQWWVLGGAYALVWVILAAEAWGHAQEKENSNSEDTPPSWISTWWKHPIFHAIIATVCVGVLSIRMFPMAVLVMTVVIAMRAYHTHQWRLAGGVFGVYIVSVLGISAYWIIPLLTQVGQGGLVFGVDQLALFSPGGSWWQVVVALLSGNGIWSDTKTAAYPIYQSSPTGWIFVGLASCYLAAIGWRTLRICRFRWVLLGLAVFGFWVASGTSLPGIAWVNRLAFEYIPLWSLYREPHKWLIFWVLFLAVFVPIGIKHLWTLPPTLGRDAQLAVAWALLGCLVVTPLSLFTRFAPLVQYPASYAEAKMVLRNIESPPSKTLALPWHWYLGCDFTQWRIVQNPAQVYFGPSIVYGSNLEFGGVSSYATDVVSKTINATLGPARQDKSGIQHFGGTLAPLGFGAIVYMKTCADAQNYTFLDKQTDLKKVFDTPSVAVYQIVLNPQAK